MRARTRRMVSAARRQKDGTSGSIPAKKETYSTYIFWGYIQHSNLFCRLHTALTSFSTYKSALTLQQPGIVRNVGICVSTLNDRVPCSHLQCSCISAQVSKFKPATLHHQVYMTSVVPTPATIRIVSCLGFFELFLTSCCSFKVFFAHVRPFFPLHKFSFFPAIFSGFSAGTISSLQGHIPPEPDSALSFCGEKIQPFSQWSL